MDEFDSLTEAVFLVMPRAEAVVNRIKRKGKRGSLLTGGDHFKFDGFQQLTDVNEPWEATEIRHALFNKEWSLISSRIENVMLSMNTMVLSAIYDFVEKAYTQKMTRTVMPIQELPTGLIFAGINIPDHDLLFQQLAQILAAPTSPMIDTELSLDIPMETTQKNVNNKVVILQSKDCINLKAALKSMIQQFLGLNMDGAINSLESGLKLQNHDMFVLEQWYRSLCTPQEEKVANQQRQPTLVVIIQDFESFDQDTLQDLVTICSNYQDRIPFVFLMGLATSIDALHQGLPKSVLSLMQTRKFQMQQSSECLTAIIEDLFMHGNVSVMIGPLPMKQLIDQFMHYNFSVSGFVANLKYIVMHHFYANPLSILCDRALSSQSRALELLEVGHYDHIRMLPSFQRYVESKVEVDPQEGEMLLLDNEFLKLQIPDMVRDLQEYHRNFALVFEFLWFLQARFTIAILKKSKRALYFMALEGTLTDSTSISFLLNLVRKMNSNEMMIFIEDCLQFFKKSSRCRPKASVEEGNIMDKELLILQNIRDRMVELLGDISDDSVTSSSDVEDGDQEMKEGDDTEQNEEATQMKDSDRWALANGGTSKRVLNRQETAGAPIFIKKRKLVSVKANVAEGRQTRIAKKTRETVRIPKGALGTYTVLVTEVVDLFERLFKTYLSHHSIMPLHEVFYYSQIKIQQKAFLPQPRVSIQTALGQPELYLNCKCCQVPSNTAAFISPAEMVLSTQHDTCILYKLYVECGRMINMYDWFTAFGMILERGTQSDNQQDRSMSNGDESNTLAHKRSKKRGKVSMAAKSKSLKEQNLDQKEVQARFISGVAELQFMGFIKPTNRKTDHVQRLTWGNI
ncbi:origin recognition complex subunit 3 N-terminus-domain-containing protein [Lobosporangium transversale]|uniref:Origin recognition complex subunit 3 n=1 Tax=Lobosporangium transversale TaxID=64571 RepID=A0A1Y2GQZ1_9FUNG|nr:origin recognition complex subunit 3 N-terminus-domain-containing protein [Lobosporangium transversale]ORZ14878.1 origin recognition complex subunit 3 N-terminus-domain-containing protein [Lobosporangium transversale]|eukprot:XP_021881010.1 origin recognition complex subunit 3 N-terminus-domain-containing protein [Lobosporangium transversale]